VNTNVTVLGETKIAICAYASTWKRNDRHTNSLSPTSASRARALAEVPTGVAFASSNLLWYRPAYTGVDTAYKHW